MSGDGAAVRLGIVDGGLCAGVEARRETRGAGGEMEALRKQANKFKEQVAKQQQVRIPHPNTQFFLAPGGSVFRVPAGARRKWA